MKRALVTSLLLVATGAAAAEFRVLGVGSLMLTTEPSYSGLTDAELGLELRLDARKLADRVDLKVDFWGREGITGNSSQQELREANATIHLIKDRLDLTLGRLFTPGGFWLVADGALLSMRYTDWLGQSIYGGLRAFTTGRQNADLTFDSPQALPLAGTSVWARNRMVDAAVTFTYAQESLQIPNSYDPATDTTSLERHTEDEFFLDAHLTLFPTDRLFLSGGGGFGTRYDVQFAAANPLAPAQIGVASLGSANAFAIADWRPVDRLRLQYMFDFERIRMIESQFLAGTPGAVKTAQAANGSFEDHALRASYLLWKSLRADAAYRLRFRENTDTEHHAFVGLAGDRLVRWFGAFASVGVDVIQPGVTVQTSRILYSGGLSFVNSFLDARAGVDFTDGIGSGLSFSFPNKSMAPYQSHPTELFPYVLETNRVAFVRLFAMWRQFFVGLDVEENLDLAQLRGLLQVGGAR